MEDERSVRHGRRLAFTTHGTRQAAAPPLAISIPSGLEEGFPNRRNRTHRRPSIVVLVLALCERFALALRQFGNDSIFMERRENSHSSKRSQSVPFLPLSSLPSFSRFLIVYRIPGLYQIRKSEESLIYASSSVIAEESSHFSRTFPLTFSSHASCALCTHTRELFFVAGTRPRSDTGGRNRYRGLVRIFLAAIESLARLAVRSFFLLRAHRKFLLLPCFHDRIDRVPLSF